MPESNILYIAVARATDNVIVASLAQPDAEKAAVKKLREVLDAPDFSYKVTPNSRYRLTGDKLDFNFVVDKEKRVYVVITKCNYPERVAFAMLNEMMKQFRAQCGERSLSVGANGLSRKMKHFF